MLGLRFIYYRAAVGVRGHVLPSVYLLTAQPKAGAVLDLLVVFFCRFVGELNQTSARPKKVPD